jgi:predicted lipoprotein with Yx(FWY)xxD motif
MANASRKEHEMKGWVLTIGAVAAAVLVAVGLGSAWASSSSAGGSTKVAVASSKLGRILVDGHGRTLYLFAKDRAGQSACSTSCAVYWPPLVAAGKPRAGAGVIASLLGTTRRTDGRLQITYRHHPLYTYVSDVSKGQTNGQGLDVSGGKWWVVSPAGTKVVKSGSGGTLPADPGYGTTVPADPGYGAGSGYGY